MPARRFDDEQEKEICRLYKDGEGAPEIARRYDCYPQAIYNALKRNGIERRDSRKFNSKETKAIIKRYVAGESANQIAHELRTHATLILNLLNRNGIETRGIKEAAAIKPLPLSEDQKKKAGQYYLEGKGIKQIAKSIGCGEKLARRAVLQCGIQIRGRGKSHIRFSEKEAKEIRDQYLKGVSRKRLTQVFDASHNAITYALLRTDTQLRTLSEAQGGLSPVGEAELLERFDDGELTTALASDFGINLSTVNNILSRNNRADINRERRGGVSSRDESEVCRLYKSGKSTGEIADQFQVSPASVIRALERNEVARRSGSEAKGGLSETEKAKVIQLYAKVGNCSAVAREFGCSQSAISRILRSAGVEINPISIVLGGLTYDQKLCMAEEYEKGSTAEKLAGKYGVSSTAICAYLNEFDIEIRPGGGFDSVQHALSGTSRFAEDEETSFYVFSLSRFPDTHCKPGIAKDAEKRAAQSDGEYGSEELRIEFPSRVEAFFLEQAVLRETIAFANCPKELEGWAGASEVRAVDAEELVRISCYMAEEMEQLGVWQFGADYVPMTRPQMLACLEKAKVSM